MDLMEYNRIVNNLKNQLGSGEYLQRDEGASLDRGNQGYATGVIALTNFRMLFQEEGGYVFEIRLHEISDIKRSKLLSFEYLEVVLKNEAHKFQMVKGSVQGFIEVALGLVRDAKNQPSDPESSSAQGRDTLDLNQINDSTSIQLKSFETLVKRYESENGPVLFGFVQDSSDGQGAGRLNKLELLISRGWEFVGMTVLASDVAPGLRETHIVVSWQKDKKD